VLGQAVLNPVKKGASNFLTLSNPHDRFEIDKRLESLGQWQAFKNENPWVTDPVSMQTIVNFALEHGIHSLHLGEIAARDICLTGENYRENFLAQGFSPRVRAMLDCLEQLIRDNAIESPRIFAPEAITPFARHMSERFENYYGSEYMPEPAQRSRHPEVPHQDLGGLSLADASFDFVLCNEVFEHLPDLNGAIREIFRVLKPGGRLLSTFPFSYERTQTEIKAELKGDLLQYYGDPEYHGDPVNPDSGALVFQIPAWDIIQNFQAAGFSDVHLRFIASLKRGICAHHAAGVFLLSATR
jgi:SAM-dependent methyltransferase